LAKIGVIKHIQSVLYTKNVIHSHYFSFIRRQYSLTEFFTSLCNSKIPIKFGRVIKATVIPDNVNTTTQ